MARQDWFRNTDWNPEIKAAFYKKLARARKKDQYLKIQAYYLSCTFPEVALDLIEEFFATGDKFFLASAFVTQASAYLSLGNIENAFMSYERALNREQEFPHAGTEAFVDYPFLVAHSDAVRGMIQPLKSCAARRPESFAFMRSSAKRRWR